MKKFYACLAIAMILVLLSVPVLVRAGDLPPIPLTTAPKTTVEEASTDFEVPVDPLVTTVPSFWISETSLTMTYRSNAKLSTSEPVTWTSSNEDVVQVSGNGSLTAVGIGKAEVRAVTADGRAKHCTVRVRYSFLQWCIMILFLGWLWGY